MKRPSLSDGGTCFSGEIPPEIWQCVITQPFWVIDSQTIASVFLLNKTISEYLLENSEAVQLRHYASKFSQLAKKEKKRYGIQAWIPCACCYKIVIREVLSDQYYCNQCKEEMTKHIYYVERVTTKRVTLLDKK